MLIRGQAGDRLGIHSMELKDLLEAGDVSLHGVLVMGFLPG